MRDVLRTVLVAALRSCSSPPTAHGAGYKTLFDGRSAQGWRHAGGARVEVREGTLRTAPGNGLGVLYYARERYRDFVLRLRFRAAEGANSGVHLRFPKPGGGRCSWIDCGHEVQINDTAADPRRTGSIYGFADLDAASARVKPAGTWSTLTIRVEGQTYTVHRDGRRINRYTASRRRSGYIGLQAHGGAQDVVAFRAIRIREL